MLLAFQAGVALENVKSPGDWSLTLELFHAELHPAG